MLFIIVSTLRRVFKLQYFALFNHFKLLGEADSAKGQDCLGMIFILK